MSGSLYMLSASDLVAGFRTGQFTPSGALASIHARLDAANPAINAVIAEDREAARLAAGESTARWKNSSPLSPIDGVPLTIKDNLLAAGLPATWGSTVYKNYVPDRDEKPVARLRAAGAVVIGKTNAPEFTLQGYTDNLIFGPTFNPHAPGLTPGGSSGGGAAAVAAGIGPVAICTDGGGSLRRPAAHCGIFGWKPSLGAVPRDGGFPHILADFEVVGPMARSLADLKLVANVLAEGTSWPMPPRPRVGFFRAIADHPVDPQIVAAADVFAANLAAAGCVVEIIAPPFDPDEVHTAFGTVAAAGLAWLLGRQEGDLAGIGGNARSVLSTGNTLTARDYLAALDSCANIRTAATTLCAGYDMLLCPAIAALAWPAEEAFPPVIDGRPAGPRGHALFTAWGNIAGLCALTLPVAMTPDRGGIGLQLLAARGRDHALLDFALGNAAISAIAAATTKDP